MFSSFLTEKPHKLNAIELLGATPGKTLLITAGMDGDEYTGIAAAQKCIQRFSSRSFSGKIIIIPIVNMPGFTNESSHNPNDGMFPKMVFPGNIRGSSTEQMIAALVPYTLQSDCWLDLHSGAITEGLNPFLWLHKTEQHETRTFIETVVKKSIAEHVVIESCSKGTKAARLAKHGCLYIVAESGSRGNRNAIDVERHIRWTEEIMSHLGMTNEHIPERKASHVMCRVRYVIAPHDGIWNPSLSGAATIQKHEIIGTAHTIQGAKPKTIPSPVAGYRLWWKETMRMKKGDVLCAIGY